MLKDWIVSWKIVKRSVNWKKNFGDLFKKKILRIPVNLFTNASLIIRAYNVGNVNFIFQDYGYNIIFVNGINETYYDVQMYNIFMN